MRPRNTHDGQCPLSWCHNIVDKKLPLYKRIIRAIALVVLHTITLGSILLYDKVKHHHGCGSMSTAAHPHASTVRSATKSTASSRRSKQNVADEDKGPTGNGYEDAALAALLAERAAAEESSLSRPAQRNTLMCPDGINTIADTLTSPNDACQWFHEASIDSLVTITPGDSNRENFNIHQDARRFNEAFIATLQEHPDFQGLHNIQKHSFTLKPDLATSNGEVSKMTFSTCRTHLEAPACRDHSNAKIAIVNAGNATCFSGGSGTNYHISNAVSKNSWEASKGALNSTHTRDTSDASIGRWEYAPGKSNHPNQATPAYLIQAYGPKGSEVSVATGYHKLFSTYVNALSLANKNGATTVFMPLISNGVYASTDPTWPEMTQKAFIAAFLFMAGQKDNNLDHVVMVNVSEEPGKDFFW